MYIILKEYLNVSKTAAFVSMMLFVDCGSGCLLLPVVSSDDVS